jgi:hypothetical protein
MTLPDFIADHLMLCIGASAMQLLAGFLLGMFYAGFLYGVRWHEKAPRRPQDETYGQDAPQRVGDGHLVRSEPRRRFCARKVEP